MTRFRQLLDRLFPHDTLWIAGEPYMHRWYVFGYAPLEDDPDAVMTCATCKAGLEVAVTDANGTKVWTHREVPDDHDPVPVSAPRAGWRWQDHGVGAFRIHCTVASDDSRAFHDHPWDFLSIGVRGSYTEVRPAEVDRDADGTVFAASAPGHSRNTRHRFRAPFVNVKRATDLHLLVVERGPVWTLFWTRPKVRSWGFADPFGWHPWRTFTAQRDGVQR